MTTINEQGKGTCPVCGQVKRLTKQHKLWPHNSNRTGSNMGRCSGTGITANEHAE